MTSVDYFRTIIFAFARYFKKSCLNAVGFRSKIRDL